MKKLLSFFMMVLVIISIGFITGCSKVPAGYKGVKVYLLGTSKGVDSEELGPGRYWIGINEDLYLFPTFTQNYTWTKNKNEGSENDESITFQTTEGLSVSADVGISYNIRPDKVNEIFQKYRKGIDEITDIYLRNIVRDAFVVSASKKSVENVYGKGKSELLKEIEKMVKDQVDPIGINIERIYLVGDLRLPQQVINALNLKIEATQRSEQKENELREAKAEAQKKIAQAEGNAKSILVVAESQAKANEVLSRSLTPELIEIKRIEKWDGKYPQVMSSSAMPLFNLKKDGK